MILISQSSRLLFYIIRGQKVMSDFELAKINLKPGENVIEFTIGGDNINFCGVTIDSASNLSFSASSPLRPGTEKTVEPPDGDFTTSKSS